MVVEESRGGTRGARIVRHRRAPPCGVRRPRSDVGGHAPAREEVYGDPTVLPLHHVHAAIVRIERCAERVAVGAARPAALVPALCRGAVRPTDDLARDAECAGRGGGERAPGVGVDRRLVVGVVVDPLNDVNLATCRPIGAVGPDYEVVSMNVSRQEVDEMSLQAGQVAQPVGMCTESMMKRPPFQVLSVVIRTL